MKKSAATWIRSRPLAAFFLIAITMSFGLLFPAMLVPRESTAGDLLSFYLGRLGVYSPVLSAMLVARVMNPGKRRTPLVRRVPWFLGVWLFAVVVHTASIGLEAPPQTPLFALVALSMPVALLPATVVSAAFSRVTEVAEFLQRLVRPRGPLICYAIALSVFPIIHFVGTGVRNVLNGEAWLSPVDRGIELGMAFTVSFFLVLLFSGGVNEESGWRGFAQSGLQARFSPLAANLILWCMLVLWHIPNDIVQYADGGYWMVRFGLYPFITVLFGWVYNRTGGSILAPAVFHASMNSMAPLLGAFPITTAGNVLLAGLTVTAVTADRMWRRLPADHPAVTVLYWTPAQSGRQTRPPGESGSEAHVTAGSPR